MATGAVLLVFVGVGIYGLLRGPDTPTPAPSPESSTPVTPDTTHASAPIEAETEPERFARTIAMRLFAWDTAAGRDVDEFKQPLIDVADPEEAPGLVADLRGYYPDREIWAKLRDAHTRQWLTIDTLTIPPTWSAVTEQARGLIPPGAAAFTITGTRHRAGIWEGQAVADAHPVSFTIFIACPTDGACRLLRLSAVDQPMP
ncbi:hypothetical protein RL72_01028 [Microbacterium azadirachtae]|uniref:Uncharacterized protein n=1 Tax=Microbacterium azadirachtae TaxID=582680 RepID=A0A0F0L1E9_9MICO|nr:hypothetical protein [Microbacterium azadirachtae]KJL26504.1 hypothetical protein RL72_01028 [Microbacterium azadirachtae]